MKRDTENEKRKAWLSGAKKPEKQTTTAGRPLSSDEDRLGPEDTAADPPLRQQEIPAATPPAPVKTERSQPSADHGEPEKAESVQLTAKKSKASVTIGLPDLRRLLAGEEVELEDGVVVHASDGAVKAWENLEGALEPAFHRRPLARRDRDRLADDLKRFQAGE